MNTICVVGLGYIGLPTATILAVNDAKVTGVDLRRDIVEGINRGEIAIEEPGLAALLKTAVKSGNLRASMTAAPADVFIIAVPTPVTEMHGADMTCVAAAAESIVSCLRPGNLVILESTSPPGTCRDLLGPILEQSGLKVGTDLYLAYCAERVLPGRILEELVSNDRVVGGVTPQSAQKARDIYARFVQGEIVLTSATTAEMIKIVENTFRDVNIALANEIALLCENLGIDFWQVARHANRHPRVNVHQAGPGVGGHCIAVDPWFLVEAFPETAGLVRSARERNDTMPAHVADMVVALVADVKSPEVVLLGLAYKAGVDDIRESPAVKVAAMLVEQGITVRCCDPHVRMAPVPLCSLETSVSGADLAVLMTDHAEFKGLVPETAGACGIAASMTRATPWTGKPGPGPALK
ncbi:MAG: UDP-N-acetyl-D-glucosamine 6-dehydrogenase [Candidatus Hydrogenedentes bacterium ADurb.Bin179]|nr:MAG: UDP-N-acetyl-D-glucosamine 6-dehydrogenase [Candidatus Hydrogenedentes bacterium ADurb.Bin179]